MNFHIFLDDRLYTSWIWPTTIMMAH